MKIVMKKFLVALAAVCLAVSCMNDGFTSEERTVIAEGEGIMRVLKSGDAEDSGFLRQEAKEIGAGMMGSEEYEILCRRMLATVLDPENTGVGIAAPQVGISRRLVAVQRFDKEGEPFEFYANPKIVRYGAEVAPGGEGCLSVDGCRGIVERAQEIDIEYIAKDGSKTAETVKGFTAVIFQHEIDHLDGILYTDRAGSYGNDYMETRRLDDGSQLTWIQDNAEPRLMPAAIFNGADKALVESLGLEEGVPASVSVFLLEKDGKHILFDAGNGVPDSRMPAALDALGVSPDEVDYVYITHLHGDHIGGMFNGEAAAFPNALVYMESAEHDAWVGMEGKNERVLQLLQAYEGRVNLFTAGDVLPCDIGTIAAYGHTPGHVLYRCGKYLVVGDLMHGIALQMMNPDICASFDMDKPAAIASRKAILEYVAENQLIMAGMHFPAPGFLNFIR